MKKFYCSQCGAEAKMKTVAASGLTGSSAAGEEPDVCSEPTCVNADRANTGIGDFEER